jgi:hypothetical protein
MNHRLLFAGPPLLPLRAVSGKINKNPLGGHPSNTIHMGAAVGGRQLLCNIAGRKLIAESFVRDRPFTKICAGPSASRSLILRVKKLLHEGLDLT